MAATEDAVRKAQDQFEKGGRGDGDPEFDGAASISDLASERQNGEDEPEDDGTPQLVLPGSGGGLTSNVGGRKPGESVFKTKAISLPISGNRQIQKDETVWVAFECAIDDVQIKNHRNKGEIVKVTRTHIAIPLGAPMILDGPPEG